MEASWRLAVRRSSTTKLFQRWRHPASGRTWRSAATRSPRLRSPSETCRRRSESCPKPRVRGSPGGVEGLRDSGPCELARGHRVKADAYRLATSLKDDADLYRSFLAQTAGRTVRRKHASTGPTPSSEKTADLIYNGPTWRGLPGRSRRSP